MHKTLLAAATALLAACTPPPEVPPPRFKPNPPYPPEIVGPYAPPQDNTSTDPAPPPPEPTRPGEHPTARRTANPNEVISPYEPYNIIDIEGFRTGQLARDPSNNKIFRVP
jgi:hypothetical protein